MLFILKKVPLNMSLIDYCLLFKKIFGLDAEWRKENFLVIFSMSTLFLTKYLYLLTTSIHLIWIWNNNLPICSWWGNHIRFRKVEIQILPSLCLKNVVFHLKTLHYQHYQRKDIIFQQKELRHKKIMHLKIFIFTRTFFLIASYQI